MQQQMQMQQKPKQILNVDDQVIPTHGGGGGANNIPEYADGQGYNEEESKFGEPIPKSKIGVA